MQIPEAKAKISQAIGSPGLAIAHQKYDDTYIHTYIGCVCVCVCVCVREREREREKRV